MQDMGGLAISLNCVMSKGNYTTTQILDSSTEDAVDKKTISHANTYIFSPLHSHTFSLCCKQNVNVFQALRYISAISGTVLSTTMVCREQWSRDQCSISWISEGDILCKFISHCEQASQLVNGTVCTTALFTCSLQSTRLSPCILSLYPLHRLARSFSSHHSPLWLS